MLKRIVSILTSLRLTVICLAFGVALVFFGTLAQVHEGLYVAQARWFKSFIVWWQPEHASWKIPIMPGGYLLGTVLLVNLIAAHLKRFQYSWKKTGILLAHFGIILLLVGQLATDLLARESQMHLAEGQTRTFTESFSDYELAFVTDAESDQEEVVAIPQSFLTKSGEISHPKLPFTVRVKEFMPNSDPSFRAPQMKNGPLQGSQGIALKYEIRPRPVTYKSDDKNVPTAVIELSTSGASLGTWLVSGWADDEMMRKGLEFSWRRQMGPELAQTMAAPLAIPQTVTAGGHTYTMALRPTRYYTPFSVSLLETKHEQYLGTDIPKNFQSRVRIENPVTRENREVDIYMNNPLRYEGLTFFQYQMGPDQVNQETPTSTFQVVRNPGWVTPYAGCALVGGGLVVQFMTHLIGFVKKRRTK